MGEETMSGIERRIEQWRTDMSGREPFSTADIDELESHMRDDIDHLKASGLSDDEAFLVARRRLGDTAALECEYSKVDLSRRLFQRLSWGIMGVLLYFTALTLANAASVLPVQLLILAGLLRGDSHYMHSLGTLMNIVRIVTFLGAILLAVWFYARHLRRRMDSHSYSPAAKPTLVAIALAIGTIAFVGIRILATQIVWRGITIAPNYRYTELEFQIAAPVLLAGLFITLYRQPKREARPQS
jgi:hypothetical protein